MLAAALLLAPLLLAPSAYAQDSVTRVVAVPLQGPSELSPWQIGVPAVLQRSLNVIDGVFVPPVGDPIVLADRAAAAGLDPAAAIAEHFSADALLGGRVASAPAGLDVTLERIDGSGQAASRTVTVPADPAVAFPQIVAVALELLAFDIDDAERDAVLAVAAQAPSIEGLQAVAVASARLAVPDASRLRAADDLAPGQSWTLAERARGLALTGDAAAGLAIAQRATEAEPADVEAWTILGVVAERAGELETAERAYRTGLEGNPAHAVARAGLAGLLGADDAIREYQRALDAYPRLLEAYLALADAQGGARGLQLLRSASSALPDSIRLHRAVLQRVLAAGDSAGAVAYLRDTLTQPLSASPGIYALAADLPADRAADVRELLAAGAEAHPDDVTLALAHARFLREQGEPVDAEDRLRPLLEAQPNDPRLANALALALVAQERLDEARDVLDSVADESATVRFNLAQALLEAGLPRAAAEELEPDIGPDQGDAEVWAVYGTALAGAGRLDDARDALDRALELDSSQNLAQRTLRRLQERQAVAPDGIEDLPREARAAFDRGLTDLEQGRFAEAAVELRRAYDATPGETPLLAFYLANALQRDGRPNEAIELYEQVVAAFPESGTVLNNYGFAWLQLGRYDRALPTLRDAVEAAPDNARAHLNLGLTYYGLSRFADALASWDRAVELDPSLEPAIRDSRERAERQAPNAP